MGHPPTARGTPGPDPGAAEAARLICGLKLTHDGGIAVIDDGVLRFSVESEKIANRPRYSRLSLMQDVVDQLHAHKLQLSDIDAFSIDGWVQSTDGHAGAAIITTDGQDRRVDLAGYAVIADPGQPEDAFVHMAGSGLPIGSKTFEYTSFPHATDHALASYCTSPAAARGEPALVCVWDGGMPATLYHVDPSVPAVTAHGTLVDVVGAIYPVFASHFEPFRVSPEARRRLGGLGDFSQLEALLPISGKVMAYAALGEPDDDVIAVMDAVADGIGPIGVTGTFMWSAQVLRELGETRPDDADVLCSFQEFLLRRLLRGLTAATDRLADRSGGNLSLAGGCALNIRWNARIRASGMVDDVWVPPFPNDAGNAIGAASAEMIRRSGRTSVSWSVYGGPQIAVGDLPSGWADEPCSIQELAAVLHRTGEPVVVLHGAAEIGPRALGHRSIIAPAVSAGMKDALNEIKGREGYRPVAPICLESKAPEVFDPGSPDPYMLFEHRVTDRWLHRVPAIVHADGSARLQTVGPDAVLLHALLTAYHELSGVPVLCNTSANDRGCGFFPDVASALRWGRVDRVWSDGRLYVHERATTA